MEPETDRNIREEIVQIITRFAELCQRLYHTEEGQNMFMVNVELYLSLICIPQFLSKFSVI